MPDDHGGPQHGDRDSALPEKTLDLAPRSQVVRQGLLFAAQPTQVDDPAQPGTRGRATEGHRRLGVLLHEVVRVQGMNQVVRGLHAPECPDQ